VRWPCLGCEVEAPAGETFQVSYTHINLNRRSQSPCHQAHQQARTTRDTSYLAASPVEDGFRLAANGVASCKDSNSWHVDPMHAPAHEMSVHISTSGMMRWTRCISSAPSARPHLQQQTVTHVGAGPPWMWFQVIVGFSCADCTVHASHSPCCVMPLWVLKTSCPSSRVIAQGAALKNDTHAMG
jgi:hypothetical protein